MKSIPWTLLISRPATQLLLTRLYLYKIVLGFIIKYTLLKLRGNIRNKYLNKLVVLNKKVSIIYIWLILIMLLIGLAASIYFSNELYTNIDKYIDIYNKLKNK